MFLVKKRKKSESLVKQRSFAGLNMHSMHHSRVIPSICHSSGGNGWNQVITLPPPVQTKAERFPVFQHGAAGAACLLRLHRDSRVALVHRTHTAPVLTKLKGFTHPLKCLSYVFYCARKTPSCMPSPRWLLARAHQGLHEPVSAARSPRQAAAPGVPQPLSSTSLQLVSAFLCVKSHSAGR